MNRGVVKGVQFPCLGTTASLLQGRAAELDLERVRKTGQTANIPKQEEYLVKKLDFVQQAVDKAAANSAQHSAILSWRWE